VADIDGAVSAQAGSSLCVRHDTSSAPTAERLHWSASTSSIALTSASVEESPAARAISTPCASSAKELDIHTLATGKPANEVGSSIRDEAHSCLPPGSCTCSVAGIQQWGASPSLSADFESIVLVRSRCRRFWNHICTCLPSMPSCAASLDLTANVGKASAEKMVSSRAFASSEGVQRGRRVLAQPPSP